MRANVLSTWLKELGHYTGHDRITDDQMSWCICFFRCLLPFKEFTPPLVRFLNNEHVIMND